MKAANLNSAQWLSCWWHGDSIALKNFFFICFYFWFVLLLCRLLRRDPSELERNLGCSMKTLHELCESQFCEGIGKKIAKEKKDKIWRSIYHVG